MSDPSPSSPPSSQPPSSQPAGVTSPTTVIRRRTVRHRPPLLSNLLGFIVDLVIVVIFLALFNWPALRDSIFVTGISQGGPHAGSFTVQPLLARGFLATVLPWLDAAIIFAFFVRTLTRITGTNVFTLLLGLLARLAGAAVIVYMLLQPIIFSAPSGVSAPIGGGTLQAFVEFWGRAVLIVVLVVICLGVLAQLWRIGWHRRR